MPDQRAGTTLRIQSSDAAPGHARHWLRRTFGGVDADVLDDAVLAVSELVTNARRHAGGMITVAAQCDPHGLAVAVVDDSPAGPAPFDSGPLGERGRGLQVVDALADAWGWRRAAAGSGKAVWFRIGRDRLPPRRGAGDG